MENTVEMWRRQEGIQQGCVEHRRTVKNSGATQKEFLQFNFWPTLTYFRHHLSSLSKIFTLNCCLDLPAHNAVIYTLTIIKSSGDFPHPSSVSYHIDLFGMQALQIGSGHWKQLQLPGEAQILNKLTEISLKQLRLPDTTLIMSANSEHLCQLNQVA